jgi:tubulin alpha
MPAYVNMNRMVAQVISSITAATRFNGSLNADLADFQTNLVPFPTLPHLLASYSPINCADRLHLDQLSVSEITHMCFENANLMARCDVRIGKFLGCNLLYRGNVPSKDIGASICLFKTNKKIQFVDWSPAGFKLGITN